MIHNRYYKAITIGIVILITSGVFYLAAGLMGRGNDVAWHTLNGLQMIESGHIILTDNLTWKTPGHVWSNPEWLFDVLLGYIYLNFGWLGVRLLVVVCGELLMLVLVNFALTRQKMSTIMPIGLIIAISLIPGYTARPQILSYLMFALGIYVIESSRSSKWSKLLLFIPAFIVWNNAHGSAVLFWGLLALEWFDDHKIWPYVLVFLALITIRPGSSFELAHFMQQQLHPVALSISEWQSPNFHIPLGLFELGYFAFSCMLIFRKTTTREKAWLVFGWLAFFVSVRFYAYAAIITWFILIKHLEVPPSWNKTMQLLTTSLVILVFCLFPKLFGSQFYEPVESGAAQYCVQNGLTNVVNEYSIGGVLEWHGLKTIGDGRAFWLGEKWFSTYFDTEYGTYPMKQFLVEEAPTINTVIWLNNTPPALQMDLMPDWKKVYDNKSVSVWVKSNIDE